MTPRWRLTLRLRRLVRLLLEYHVPLGVMHNCVTRIAALGDGELGGEAKPSPAQSIPTWLLASELVNELLGDDIEPSVGANETKRYPAEPRDLLRVGDEIERRRAAARQEYEKTGEQAANAVACELDELLAFMGPLYGAPLPELEAFDEFLASSEFYNLMQAYRLANIVVQPEVTGAFEAVKAALRKAVRK